MNIAETRDRALKFAKTMDFMKSFPAASLTNVLFDVNQAGLESNATGNGLAHKSLQYGTNV